MILSVALPGFPPLPNKARTQHWHERSDDAQTWRYAAKMVALQALREHPFPGDFPLQRATLELVAVGVKADPDNCIAAMKPCIDGMVDAGVLLTDSWKTLHSLSVRREDGPLGLRIDVVFGSVA